ncbi:MAG TPA: FAD-binding oxidoreductase [Fimbriimonadaceae bacterium]|nr:FAD-binding oxidoreductase [Fimbriimonadaceae bacterium]
MSAPTAPQYSMLVDRLQGTVATPGSDAFEASRTAWNLTVTHQPELVVEAQSAPDVQAAVQFANEQGLTLTVQTTGHGQPQCAGGGVLILLGKLNTVTIDREARTAKVGGGAVWADVIGPAHAAGLAPLSGSSPGVGVVGYLLGGGYGLMMRTYGLAVDMLKKATVILADGSIVTASPTENADLFYALRGGGGAFGIVTELEIGLVPHAEVFAGSVAFDAGLAPQVYRAWSEWTHTLPNEVTSGTVLITFPPVPFVPEFLHGRSLLILTACSTLPQAESEALLAPIRSMAGAELDSFRWMPFTESATIYNDPVDPLPAIGTGALLTAFESDTIDTFLGAIGPIPQSPNLMIQVRHAGGASADVPTPETPIGNRREGRYLAYLLGVPMGPFTPEAIGAHGEACLQALEPWILARGPLNWVGEATVSADQIRGVYDDASFARLLEIKRRVDPKNVFSRAGVGIWIAAQKDSMSKDQGEPHR